MVPYLRASETTPDSKASCHVKPVVKQECALKQTTHLEKLTVLPVSAHPATSASTVVRGSTLNFNFLHFDFSILAMTKTSMIRSPASTFKMTHLVATLVPIFSIFIIALIIRYTCCRRDEYSRTLLFEEDDNEIDDETKVPKSVSQCKTTAPLKTNYTEVRSKSKSA